MAETETEFMGYGGDCNWAAVHMAAHRLAPAAWPVPSATILNRLTSEAIAAGIDVGPRGEATPGQLQFMLDRWGMKYSIGYDYDSRIIPTATLRTILDNALIRGKPVLLGFTNGQALTGDEVGLHGHEIVALHPITPAGYPCGDGDNPRCRVGELVYYPLAMLEAAQPDSAYVLEEVPSNMVPQGWTDDGTTLKGPNGIPVVRGFREYVLGHAWDAANIPLTSEYPNGGSRQDFACSSLGWTAAGGVVLLPLGQERVALEKELGDLKATGARTPIDVTNAAALKLLATALQQVK